MGDVQPGTEPVDPSICQICKRASGGNPLDLLAGLPVCEGCTVRLRNRPFPTWLRYAFLVLLGLTICWLVTGRQYFVAEAAFLRARRGMEQGRYAEASGNLASVLKIAPGSREALLLKIKADILSDNMGAAMEGVQKAESRQFEGKLIGEVNALLARVERAMKECEAAGKMAQDGKSDEVLHCFERARGFYPESGGIRLGLLLAKASVHFDRKEWDAFLSASEDAAELAPANPQVVAAVASALAAKYASGGDETFRQRATAKLAEARALCKTDEERTEYEEYRERIEHRLSSREIIEKREYDRRFRSKP